MGNGIDNDFRTTRRGIITASLEAESLFKAPNGKSISHEGDLLGIITKARTLLGLNGEPDGTAEKQPVVAAKD